MSSSLDILIFGAHPDDAEIGMGGTIVKHTLAGYRVGICDLTHAELSSNGTVETRKQEADAASQILGIAIRSNLGLPDRGLFMCMEQINAIVLEIRKHQPRIVFAPYWQDRHPDHVMCSQLVQEAVFNAKLRRYIPQVEAVKVEQLFFYFVNDVYDADVMIDVTTSYESKSKALLAYKTQFFADEPDQVKTPINQGYLERVVARDRLLGQQHSVDFAEGFVSKLPLLLNLFH